MNFDTVFPTPYIIIAACLVLLSLFITWRRYLGQLKVSYLSLISISRIIAVLLAFFFALRPYSVEENPDTDSFGVAVLVDVSSSMNSADCNGATRLQTVQDIHEKAWFKTLKEKYNIFYQTFSSKVHPFPKDGQLKSQSGGTDIQQALANVRQLTGSGSLGAVLLMTDGQENSGSVTEEAKIMRREGVPITTIGIGGERELEDIAVTFENVPKTRRKNKEFELMVKVKKNMAAPLKKEIILKSGDLEISRQTIELPAGKAEQLFSFKHREYTAGFKNYRASVEAVAGEMVTSNNVDYTAVKINEDEKVRILYFSGNLSWEYKFLDKLCDDSENLELSALIRTGEKAWYYYAGKEEKKFAIFPETEELIEYDVIIFDLGAEYLINEKAAENIEKFAFEKGGGLLFLGRLGQNSQFKDLLPVIKTMPQSASGKKVLDISNNSLLVPRSKKDLTDLANILYIKGGKMFYTSTPADLKKSARPDMQLKGSARTILLSSLYYGSGRTSYLGVETWPWKMNPKNSGDEYAVFWKRMLTWLSSSSVQQLKVIPAYRKFAVGEIMDMAVDLLDPDFEPSVTASVKMVIKKPSGDIVNLNIPASLDIEGRFSLAYVPDEIGEYIITTKVVFADETELSKKVAFLATELSGENGTLPLNRRLLEDVSRITGGDFVYWSSNLDELKLSKQIPIIQKRNYYFNGPLTLAAILLFFSAEWYLRRRIGLR